MNDVNAHHTSPAMADLALPAHLRARALVPLLDAHTAEIDRRRELTQEVVDALVRQDLLRLLLPRGLGGQEIPLLEFCRTTEAVAIGDASTGWFVNQSNVSSASSAAAMPPEAAAQVFRGPGDGLAWGSKHNRSVATRVEGGYRLSGTWSYASGSRHTTWIGAHSAVTNPDGSPHMRNGVQDDRSFLFPKSQAEVVDDWQVLGLRGTGSDTYTVRDLFVPDAFAPARDDPAEKRWHGPLFPIGSTLMYATGFCGVTMGVARRMLDTYIELSRVRHSRSSSYAMAANQAVHREIGLLEAKLSAARAFLHQAVADVYDASVRGCLDVDLRVRLRLATTYGMNEATEVSVACYRGAGTMAIHDSAPFERRLRDALSASQHLQAMMSHVEMAGRHLIGTGDPPAFI